MNFDADSAVRPGSPTLGRFHAILATVATISILIGVPVLVVTHRPSWTMRPLAFASPGESFQPRAWSPDGTMFLFSRLDQYVVVRVADAERVFTGYGASPTWVDNDTIDATTDIGLGRSQILSMSISGRAITGTLPPIFESARLLGEGPLELAATESFGSIWSSVFDPRTGRIVAHLADVRAIDWAGRGRLITKTSEPMEQSRGTLPGHLRVWTARDGLRPIGGDLLEIDDSVSVAPSGDAIVCRCELPTDDPRSDGSIYVVPLDGTPPRKLFDVTRGDHIQPNFGWVSDGSLVVLDGVGLHRSTVGGTALAVPAVPGADLPAPKYAGRAYVLGGEIVVGSQLGSGPRGSVLLTIRDLDGNVELRQTFPSWNGLGLVVDHDRPRALVVTDPQRQGEAPEAYFVLERMN